VSNRRQRRFMSQINVVPYIDVMLVLLIIFMVTAPMIHPGEIDLPRMSEALRPPVAPLEVIIKADKTLLLSDKSQRGGKRVVSRSELVRAIREKQRQNPEQPVVIAADKRVRYEEVLKVMDILRRNQVKKIGLLARSGTG